ncbi:hypothetical protein ARSEF4850_002958 [Beauveria asiatica]
MTLAVPWYAGRTSRVRNGICRSSCDVVQEFKTAQRLLEPRDTHELNSACATGDRIHNMGQALYRDSDLSV